MCFLFFSQKICCALISLIVFPEKSSPIVRTICIPVCAYVHVYCVYVYMCVHIAAPCPLNVHICDHLDHHTSTLTSPNSGLVRIRLRKPYIDSTLRCAL